MKKTTRQIRIGDVPVGGGAPCSVQSMCNTDTRDTAATIAQITALAEIGCELVRCAVLDMEAAEALGEIKSHIPIPLIADIHFDYKLALKALEKGVDGLRINPGNIGERWKVAEVVKSASERLVPIRIGVNAGSLEKELLERYGHPTAEAMVESALGHVRILEELGYDQIKISLKASDVMKTVEAYRLLSRRVDYPLHIGITEAGTTFSGAIKSSVGLGILLAEGIGDTLRVSLTGDPVDEIRVGYGILKALGLRQRGINLVSCPTCGRCQINLIPVAEEVERRLQKIIKPINVAVMGCVVNGPGEAREADVGIAGGRGEGLLFRHGEIVRKVPESELADALVAEVEKMAEEPL
jgi:(E)-4-hydroxy-3-methylbut-2-enyl-diphosphate synthase